jgi:hypothetical protein
MLNFVPDPQSFDSPEPYAEAVARLAGIRHALRLVDPHGGGPACDIADEQLGEAWLEAPYARRRCFDNRSGRVIAATAEGLEALLAERSAGREPNPAASAEIAADIRRGLRDVARQLLGAAEAPRDFRDSYPLAL